MKKFKPKLDINVSKYIACHLYGEHHTNSHRVFIGICIIMLGVYLMHTEITHFFPVILLQQTFGVVLHGIGVIPIIAPIEKKRFDHTLKPEENEIPL